MKAMTGRRSEVDLSDAAELCIIIGITDARGIRDVVKAYWGAASRGVQELFFGDIADRADGLRRDRGVHPGAKRPAIALERGRCGLWMPRAGRSCLLPVNHRGQHR
jgi:hypothetical protein